MICPNCQTTLLMTDRQGVEIDYCPSCRGIWLDKGELDKILERSNAEMPPVDSPTPNPPAARPQQHPSMYDGGYSSGKYSGYPPKKKKSFLSDLLDFD